jgi:hypothetical protein
MPRYRAGQTTLPSIDDGDPEPDLDVFGDAAQELADHAPVTLDANLFDDTKFLLTKSIGSFGIFRDWLDRSCIDALTSNGGLLTRAIFERAALPNKTILTLDKEAHIGETEIEDISEVDLAKELGLEYLREPERGDAPPARPARKKQGKRVGARGPSRDPVGGLCA